MKENMGPWDGIIRVSIAVILAILYYSGILSGTLGIVLLAVGAIFFLTSFFNFCPIYSIFGITTRKVK